MPGISTDISHNEHAGNKPTFKEIITQYVSYYPLFIISLVICIGAAIFHIRYTVPIYNATALILVKDATTAQHTNSSSNDLVDNAVSGGVVNLQNDMMLLHSSSLMNRVVQKKGFNISYYKIGKFISSDVYQNIPFRLLPQSIPDSNASFSIIVTKITKQGGEVQFGQEKNKHKLIFQWNNPFTVEGRTLVLALKGQLWGETESFNVEWKPIEQAAGEISNNFSVGMSGTNNTIIELNLRVENLDRGKDILNAVADEFIQASIEEKNKISQNTIHFINDRLAVVSQELGGVEGTLENYQGRSQMIDPVQQSSQLLKVSNDVVSGLRELTVQQQVVEMIRQYVSNPKYEGKLVPSSLGIADATLTGLVGKYNDLQLTKEREAPLNASGSLILKDLNAQISNVKGSILESLQNIAKNLKLQESNLQQQQTQNNQSLSSIPKKERGLQEMKRKQSITEELYLYLLQKKEENALILSSTVSNYKQIDPATGYGPVEPDKLTTLKFAGLIGLLIPISFVYIRTLLNDKVSSKNDITKKTSLPITGEVEHIKKLKKYLTFEQAIKGKGGIEHQLQILRTNLSVLYKKRDKNIFLVTSSVSGEGKSLISRSLATILAQSGKKVALLQFDFRKPDKSLCASAEIRGLSDYLNCYTNSLSELFYSPEEIPALHVYPSGPVKSDPANLLINDRLPQLFESLKQQYDYIIINSAPVGYVSDALILGEYSDLVLYVIRHQFTEKKQLTLIEDMARTGKLNNICLVVNGVRTGSKYRNYVFGAYYNN